MGRFLMLVAVAVVAAAMYVAASPASQQSGPTAKQFRALKAQVARLSHKVKALTASNNAIVGVLSACMQGAVPVAQFGDQGGNFGYEFDATGTGTTFVERTALDVTLPSDPNALWITGSTGTGCHTLLGAFLRHAAAKAGVKLQPLTLPSSFAEHRH